MASFEEASRHLNQLIKLRMKAANIPGLAAAVTDREATLLILTQGFADMAARTPVTAETRFEIGSIGKSFTNIALLQLHDAGRLDLHAPVTRYLPWFQVQSDYEPITIYHLMTHTAGIITGTELAPHGRYEAWALRETKAACPPGLRFHYSNVGYKTLGFLLEDLLGRGYQDIVQSCILDPLGMTDTDAVITFDGRRHAAVGYRYFYDDRPEHVSYPMVPVIWGEYGTGDGCLASTAGDMAAYVRMLLNNGQGPQGRLLSAKSMDLMTQPAIERGNGVFYGCGLNISEIDGHNCVGHGGSTPGSVSEILADRDNGLGVFGKRSRVRLRLSPNRGIGAGDFTGRAPQSRVPGAAACA